MIKTGVQPKAAVPESVMLDAVARTAAASRAWHAEREDAVIADARRLLARGATPTLRQALGVEHREVPINRTLGWLLNPSAAHGAGAALLASFATWLGAHGLAAEADSTEAWCEGGAPAWGTREPDLLFRSPGAALLVENKVYAGEGRRQFADYAAAFELWSGDRVWQTLVVMARGHRKVPPPYMFRTHRELAEWVMAESRNPEHPIWTRNVLTMLGSDLCLDPPDVTLREVQHLVQRSSSRRLKLVEVLRLSRAVSQLPPPPWETK